MHPTAYLYVPGNRPERFAKALASGAGAIVLDLEDAVAVPAKAEARAAVVEHCRQAAGAVEQWVRINTGELGCADLEAVAALPGLTGIFVPKASRAALDKLATVAGVPRCALIETAATVLDLPSVAASENIVALAMGEVDLTADLGIDPSADEHELWPFRMQVVAASAATGRRPPIGPVFTDVRDGNRLRASTQALRRAGFEARQAIHPDQVAVINDVMTPSAEDIDHAEALLARAKAAGGVWVDQLGRMVDEAVLRKARRTIARRRSP